MLLRENELCGSVNSAYWTGLVEAIFALGSIAGEFTVGFCCAWTRFLTGVTVDRLVLGSYG